MRIERFDPLTDEEQLRACYQMAVDGQPADDPNVPAMPLEPLGSLSAEPLTDFREDCGQEPGKHGQPFTQVVWVAVTEPDVG